MNRACPDKDSVELYRPSPRSFGRASRELPVAALNEPRAWNKQVAAELGISEITVKARRGMVMRKMSARTLPALVHMGLRLGVATPMQ